MTKENYEAITKVGETLAYRVERFNPIITIKGTIYVVVRFYGYDKEQLYFTEIKGDIFILDGKFNFIAIIENNLYKTIVEKAIAITFAIACL